MADQYIYTGIVHKITPIEKVGEKQLEKRILVVSDRTEKYPQTVPFVLLGDKVGLVSELKEGDEVQVNFDLRGREWKGKYYPDIIAWKVEVTKSSEIHPNDTDQHRDDLPQPAEEDLNEPPF